MFSKELLKKLDIVDYSYTEENLATSYSQFTDWVDSRKHEPLHYLSDHRKEMREDVKSFFPEFQSALVFLFDYSSEKKYLDDFYQSKESNGLKISSYVFGFNGEDYHIVIRKRLEEIADQLKKVKPDINIQLSLDIHPVLERDLANRSGLGWFGKNSMLISRKEGSFVMIASLLLDQKLDLTKRELETDHCGTCTDCIDACPTDAIDPISRTLISKKCISTWTIELFKDAEKIEGHPEKSGGEIFGCDICQDVCPWNIKKLSRTIAKNLNGESTQLLFKEFLTSPSAQIFEYLTSLSNSKFRKIFAKTPLQRTGRKGLLKNIAVYLNRK